MRAAHRLQKPGDAFRSGQGQCLPKPARGPRRQSIASAQFEPQSQKRGEVQFGSGMQKADLGRRNVQVVIDLQQRPVRKRLRVHVADNALPTQTVRRMRNHCMQRKGNGRHVRPAKRIPTCQRRLAFDRKRRRFGRAGIGSVGRTSAGRHLLAATDEGARAQKPLGDVGACRSPKLDGGTMSNNQWHGHSLTRFSRIAYTQFKYTFPWENMLDFRRREAENPPNFRRRKGDKTAPRSRREANSGRSRRPTAQKSAAARNARSCKDGHSRAAAAAHRARRKWFELEFKLELGLQLQLQPELGFELKLEPEFGPSPSSNSNPSPNPS